MFVVGKDYKQPNFPLIGDELYPYDKIQPFKLREVVFKKLLIVPDFQGKVLISEKERCQIMYVVT